MTSTLKERELIRIVIQDGNNQYIDFEEIVYGVAQ